jgi:hypothetical protein
MAEYAYNLLIIHTPTAQDISDWREVARLVGERAPDIEVRIAPNFSGNPITRKWQITRPSLVFSPHFLQNFRPRGGKIYAGHPYSKWEQVERFRAAGVAVPDTVLLPEALALDPRQWGEYVIVKSMRGSRGRTVRLVRLAQLGKLAAELGSASASYLVQQFIDTGPQPSHFRVLTIFGRPLYCQIRYAKEAQPGMASAPPGRYRLTTWGGARELRNDEDVLAFATRMSLAMAEVPVHGCDILREAATGQLYALETNPGGNTWHLSSPIGRQTQHDGGLNRYEQFGALEVVADALIERTRKEAY